MKLRNKKTGEIIETGKSFLRVPDNRGTEYKSLEELNEEWVDYEEPKEHFIINGNGFILSDKHFHSKTIKEVKEFGNYFETREEAEKAVEKLKAWKRLKDKGFRFDGWNWKTQCIDYNLDYRDITEGQIEEAEEDLDLLFGGDE